MANELLYRSSLSERNTAQELSEMERLHLYRNFCTLMEDIKNGNFCPTIVFREDTPVEFAGTELTGYQNNPKYHTETRESISKLLYEYYNTKEIMGRIHQKSADLRRITQTVLERSLKKYDLQKKQLKDTEKREKYKI